MFSPAALKVFVPLASALVEPSNKAFSAAPACETTLVHCIPKPRRPPIQLACGVLKNQLKNAAGAARRVAANRRDLKHLLRRAKAARGGGFPHRASERTIDNFHRCSNRDRIKNPHDIV